MSRKLDLIWSNPVTNEDCKIGVLLKDTWGYQFRYLQEGVQKASPYGFTALAGFPDMMRPYFSPTLFSVFERRIPSQNRKEYKEAVRHCPFKSRDELDWEYLRVNKGRLATDRLYFQEDNVQVKYHAYY